MAKFYGAIGYADLVETKPGVWEEVITERKYAGDINRNTFRLQPTDQVNDNINISNEISIVVDPYAEKNLHKMRYVEFMGAKWKISNATINRPRLVVTVGGVYNG